ncbi:MAG: hypothetical protein WCC14_08940 [Acidobacteriaceae bacterium]
MGLTNLVAVMVALSVAVERVVEIFKSMCGSLPVIRLLFTPSATRWKENLRCGCLYLLSAAVGGVIAWNTHIPIIAGRPRASATLAALLASGGSSFWNQALDIIQAAKIQKEQVAVNLVRVAAPAAVIAGMPVEP